MSEIGHGERIELHGWDSGLRGWHGPDELSFTLHGCRGILRRLRQAPGSWYGRLHAKGEIGASLSLCVSIHDLGDAGLAAVDIEDSSGGPMEIVLVIPPQRRRRVRPDLAFEFVSFLRFLEGPESPGSEMALHDYIEGVLHEKRETGTLIFSVERRSVIPEMQVLVSERIEALYMSMIVWMAEKDASLEVLLAAGHGGNQHHARV